MTIHKFHLQHSRTMKGTQMVKISKFDAADYKTPEAIAAYLTEAFATDDVAYICATLDTIARAKERASAEAEAKTHNVRRPGSAAPTRA
jgi:DNA-binding phage protein